MNLLTVVNDTTTQLISQVVPKEELTLSFWQLAVAGGWIMAVLGLMSIIAVYIFVERYMAINRASAIDKNFMNNIRDFIYDSKIDSAIALCKGQNTPIARMVEKGLTRLGKPLNDISAAVENVGKLEVAKMENKIAILGTIAGAAPMLGFLGTVTGMIKAFYDMSNAGGNIDISVLAGGIYEAMVTTVGGLVVGIIAYVMYNLLVSKIEKLIYNLEAKSTDFMDLLHEPAK